MLRTAPVAAGGGPRPAGTALDGSQMSTRMLLVLAAIAGLAILVAFTLQITLAAS